MKKVLFIWFSLALLSEGITKEVFRVFRPISLHGTDVADDFEGESIQAKILSQTMVFTGAQPEGLILEVGQPHRLAGSAEYSEKEDNLLVLCKIGLKVVQKGKELVVTFDLSKLEVPEFVELPARTVLKLAIISVKKTLKDFHSSEDAPLQVRIEIAGAKKFMDLSEKFQVKG